MAISSSQIARAAEAINRHPELSPAARRVALELLACIDRVTGYSWPSEDRIAEALNITARTVRRAKAELASLGLLSWQRRGTSWRGRTPIYSFAWDRLLGIASAIKERVIAAAQAVKAKAQQPGPAPTNAISSTAPENGAASGIGRTKVSAYLTQSFSFSSGKGFWRAPGTPQGQHLTDQQLNAKAQSRIYEALRGLGTAALEQLLNHPDATAIEAEAVKAERFSPSQGRTGLSIIAARLHGVTP